MFVYRLVYTGQSSLELLPAIRKTNAVLCDDWWDVDGSEKELGEIIENILPTYHRLIIQTHAMLCAQTESSTF